MLRAPSPAIDVSEPFRVHPLEPRCGWLTEDPVPRFEGEIVLAAVRQEGEP